MTIGIQQDGASINATSGTIALDIERVITEIEHFQAFLNQTGSAALQASPYNFSNQDAATLFSAFSDLSALAAIYRGTVANASAMDYSRFAKLLRGTSYW